MANMFAVNPALGYAPEDRLRKDLLIFACAFMNLAVVLWLAIYWLMSLHFSANVPLSYQVVSVASLLHFFKINVPRANGHVAE